MMRWGGEEMGRSGGEKFNCSTLVFPLQALNPLCSLEQMLFKMVPSAPELSMTNVDNPTNG